MRPVCDDLHPDNGRIPMSVRRMRGREPKLLDIIELPLAQTGNNFGFASENLSVLPGQWKRVMKFKAIDLFPYCDRSDFILHNDWKYVFKSDLASLPFERRHTLQLLRVTEFQVESQPKNRGQVHWKGSIRTDDGRTLSEANITDPMFCRKLEEGYRPQGNYLVTVSLSMPWSPPDWDKGDPCWKLIAGVIELPDPNIVAFAAKEEDLIEWSDRELDRIGWGTEQGRRYLIEHFGKRSRYHLTREEFAWFLSDLQVLPSN